MIVIVIVIVIVIDRDRDHVDVAVLLQLLMSLLPAFVVDLDLVFVLWNSIFTYLLSI